MPARVGRRADPRLWFTGRVPLELPDLNPRYEYDVGSLEDGELGEDPAEAFIRWLSEAGEADRRTFNTMTLSTVDADGQPSSRHVLLRDIGEGGRLRFFSNTRSRKGRAIADNPLVAVVFHWPSMHRQIHVEGLCTPCSDEVSDTYWQSRPRDSQLASTASPQSNEIPDRKWLEDQVDAVSERLGEGAVPRPAHSLMYEVAPSRFEFWQGRPHRLHDRIEFTRLPEGADAALTPVGDRWITRRLAP